MNTTSSMSSKRFSKSVSLPGNAPLPPPELPVPNAEEVARFQSLFLAQFGVELAEEEAYDQARRLVQFVFLMEHALPYLNKACDFKQAHDFHEAQAKQTAEERNDE